MNKQTEIWAVTNEGEIIFEKVQIKKQSRQIKDDFKGLPIVEPRYKFDDLLFYLEVNSWHKRCVYLKAAVTGALGWRLTTDDDNKGPDAAYKQITAFLENPNPKLENFSQILLKMLIDYYAIGNGFLEIVRNTKGEAAELYHIPGRTMRRKRDFSGYYQVRTFKKVEFNNFGDRKGKRNEVLHYLNYDPMDDYYGLPDWITAMATMGMDRNAVEYNAYEFTQGLMARFLIIIEGGELSRKARTQLKNFLKNNMIGTQNSGKVMVVANDDPNVKIRVERIDKEGSNRDMSFHRMRTFNRDEVIEIHGVPPRMLGIMSAGQLGGGGETAGQLKIFKETLIDPEQRKLEYMLNQTIIKSFGEHKWKLKLKEMDITDQKADAEFYEKMINSQVLDPDEVREEIGRKPRQQEVNLQNLTKILVELRKSLENDDFDENM
ncbi:portal protein [Caldithrix abyssi DSM 13497]|uniref:Portal protein n=1 Tax=Caldithrix abyssi DSM 13497 TaxID=880073 RepID=H1XPV8_CALAY|nr:phage portal protein [Caldithrix abyssi]APF20387.1 phage portal protein, HK97 family/phage portal protein, PBSX family,TIGR01540 [Caldithrix abyssi DSM 13497]EHO41084.1 portal protein [Caldithrix abyssi DSM 13497]